MPIYYVVTGQAVITNVQGSCINTIVRPIPPILLPADWYDIRDAEHACDIARAMLDTAPEARTGASARVHWNLSADAHEAGTIALLSNPAQMRG